MDFDDTPEEAAFRADARAWLEANAIPKGSPDDFSAGHFSGTIDADEYVKRCRWWQGQLYEGGWAGISWPNASNTSGCDFSADSTSSGKIFSPPELMHIDPRPRSVIVPSSSHIAKSPATT